MEFRTASLVLVTLLGGWVSTLPLAAADRGFYVGGSFGRAEYRSACDSLLAGSTALCEERGDAWKVFGGYQVNRHWGLEAGWSDLGTTSFRFSNPAIGEFGRLTETGATLVGTWTLPVARRLALFVHGGLLAWRTSAEYDFGRGRFSASDNGLSQVAGVGLRLSLGESLALRAEMERFFGGAKTFAGASRRSGETTPVDVTSIGLVLSF